MANIAVIILNWNGASLLQQFLPSVTAFSKSESIEVWVADNASSDNSLLFLANEYPEVKVLAFDKNYGFAAGYNKAISAIECNYAVLLNSDVEVSENWLSPLLKIMESDESIVACMPKIKDHKRKEFFEYAGASGGFIDKNGYVFCRGRIFNTIEPDRGQYNNSCEVFWASGAAMMVKRNVYLEAGGLDEDFFAHMEEIDFCWRMKNRGFRVMVQPESVVYHVGGATLSQSNPLKTYLNFRNNLLMMYKNLPEHHFFKIMFRRKCLDMLAAGVMLAKCNPKGFVAVLKAHVHYYKMIQKNFHKKRSLCLQKASVTQHHEMIDKNLVLLHFLGKCNKFSQLYDEN